MQKTSATIVASQAARPPRAWKPTASNGSHGVNHTTCITRTFGRVECEAHVHGRPQERDHDGGRDQQGVHLPFQHRVSTASAPRQHHQHHVSTKSAPRQHHASTTPAPRQHHVSTTSALRQHTVSTTPAPRQHHASNTTAAASSKAITCSPQGRPSMLVVSGSRGDFGQPPPPSATPSQSRFFSPRAHPGEGDCIVKPLTK